MCPGTSLHVLLENKVNHHYVGGYYGAASEEEMKRELVSCRNLCQGSEVHKTVGHPHFWKVMLASGGSWPLSKLSIQHLVEQWRGPFYRGCYTTHLVLNGSIINL